MLPALHQTRLLKQHYPAPQRIRSHFKSVDRCSLLTPAISSVQTVVILQIVLPAMLSQRMRQVMEHYLAGAWVILSSSRTHFPLFSHLSKSIDKRI
jgi:hypothetical protein